MHSLMPYPVVISIPAKAFRIRSHRPGGVRPPEDSIARSEEVSVFSSSSASSTASTDAEVAQLAATARSRAAANHLA